MNQNYLIYARLMSHMKNSGENLLRLFLFFVISLTFDRPAFIFRGIQRFENKLNLDKLATLKKITKHKLFYYCLKRQIIGL